MNPELARMVAIFWIGRKPRKALPARFLWGIVPDDPED